MGTLLVALVIGGLIALALAGWAAIALIAGTDKAQKKSEANAPQLLDDLFDGSENVTYKTTWSSMKYETVLLGAKERGYRLWQQSDDPKSADFKTLIFEKVPTSP